MQAREIEALERWIVEYGDGGTPTEAALLAERLRDLLTTPEGDEAENWDYLVLSAERVARRGSSAADRAASRTLVAVLSGDLRAIAALLPAPPGTRDARRARPATQRARPSGRALTVAAAVIAAAVAGGVELAKGLTTPSLAVTGPPRGAAIGAPGLRTLAFVATGSTRELQAQHWTLDGRNITSRLAAEPGRRVFRPDRLSEGPHVLDVTAGGGFLGATAHRRFAFDVDLTPPSLSVMPLVRGISWHPVAIRGSADEGSRVTVDGHAVEVDNGRFSARVQPPVPPLVPVVATDAAGNRIVADVTVSLAPRRPPVLVRAVHVTADAWANPTLRGNVLALIAQHRINTVEIDLKDEGGIVGFTGVAAANRMGATRPIYDLASAIKELHAKGVRVIGRLVCFRDPIAAAASWKAGDRSEVVQTPSGAPYAGYGGFTNFASPAVRRYEIAIAVAAARDGIDEVLYDYVRRPDGPISSMSFPGLRGTPSQAIVEFLRETRVALRPYGTFLGASVFGIAATRPDEVAQDVPAMAREVDYLSPMVYPSHWNNGEYGVPDPNEEPFAIVQRSLLDFKKEVAGTGARLVPWLQDFSLGVTYGPAQVKEQVDAARSDGVGEFLLWNPDVVYDGAGLSPDASPERSALTARADG